MNCSSECINGRRSCYISLNNNCVYDWDLNCASWSTVMKAAGTLHKSFRERSKHNRYTQNEQRSNDWDLQCAFWSTVMMAPGTLHQSFRERSKHMIIIPWSVSSVVNPICAICDYLLQLYHLLHLSHLLSLVQMSWKNHTICGNCNHL